MHTQQDQEYVITASRVVYAAGTAIVTIGAASVIGLTADGAKEVALLNGAVAFYSHEATSRIVVAIRNAVRRTGKGSSS